MAEGKDVNLNRSIKEQNTSEFLSTTDNNNFSYQPQSPSSSSSEESSPLENTQYTENSRTDDSSRYRVRSASKGISPTITQWLHDNYEPQEGTSLPRSALYAHYVSFCEQMSIECVNAASFGKLIRNVFPGLRTRRLGTRGHSKYHYYGVRIKPTSDLKLSSHDLESSQMSSSSHHQPAQQGRTKRVKREDNNNNNNNTHRNQHNNTNNNNNTSFPNLNTNNNDNFLPQTPQVTPGAQPLTLPDFGLPDGFSIASPDISFQEAQNFLNLYHQHSQSIVDAAYKHYFADIEKILRHFWQGVSMSCRVLISVPEMIAQIVERDQITYRAIAAVVLPNVLQALPVTMPQSIRTFARQLEQWVGSAMETVSPVSSSLVIAKMAAVKRFSQSLHKQASLNHLTQAARAVLQNPAQLSNMVQDWARLDFGYMREQAAWVCQCSDEIIQSTQETFKHFLMERAGLEQWAQWLQEIVIKHIGKYSEPREMVAASQQLLLKWSFYSTLIIRDLTIRNASSFGSFHLLRTLFDEYLFYLVELRIGYYSPPPLPIHPQQQQQPSSMYPMYSDSIISHPHPSHPLHHQQHHHHENNATVTINPFMAAPHHSTTSSTTTASSSDSFASSASGSSSYAGSYSGLSSSHPMDRHNSSSVPKMTPSYYGSDKDVGATEDVDYNNLMGDSYMAASTVSQPPMTSYHNSRGGFMTSSSSGSSSISGMLTQSRGASSDSNNGGGKRVASDLYKQQMMYSNSTGNVHSNNYGSSSSAHMSAFSPSMPPMTDSHGRTPYDGLLHPQPKYPQYMDNQQDKKHKHSEPSNGV